MSSFQKRMTRYERAEIRRVRSRSGACVGLLHSLPHLTSPWSGGGSDASLEKTSLLFQHIRARIYFANCQVGEKK